MLTFQHDVDVSLKQAAHFSSRLLSLLWKDHVQCYDYIQNGIDGI